MTGAVHRLVPVYHPVRSLHLHIMNDSAVLWQFLIHHKTRSLLEVQRIRLAFRNLGIWLRDQPRAMRGEGLELVVMDGEHKKTETSASYNWIQTFSLPGVSVADIDGAAIRRALEAQNFAVMRAEEWDEREHEWRKVYS